MRFVQGRKGQRIHIGSQTGRRRRIDSGNMVVNAGLLHARDSISPIHFFSPASGNSPGDWHWPLAASPSRPNPGALTPVGSAMSLYAHQPRHRYPPPHRSYNQTAVSHHPNHHPKGGNNRPSINREGHVNGQSNTYSGTAGATMAQDRGAQKKRQKLKSQTIKHRDS